MSKLQIRGDKASIWARKNPILAPREPGVETDTFKLKIGNGVLKWNDLPYASGADGLSAGDIELLLEQVTPESIGITNQPGGRYTLSAAQYNELDSKIGKVIVSDTAPENEDLWIDTSRSAMLVGSTPLTINYNNIYIGGNPSTTEYDRILNGGTP